MLIGVAEATRKIPAEGRDDRGAADRERQGRGDDGSEDEEERQRRERERDHLAPPEVGLGDLLDVAVEGRPAGQSHLELRHVHERRADAGQRERGVVGREVQGDDVVGGVAVGRDLARREGVRQDVQHVRLVVDAGDRPQGRGLERRLAGPERRRVEDDGHGRLRYADLVVEELLGPGGLEVPADEAAGPERIARLGGKRDRAERGGSPTRRRSTSAGGRPTGRGVRRRSRPGRRGHRGAS